MDDLESALTKVDFPRPSARLVRSIVAAGGFLFLLWTFLSSYFTLAAEFEGVRVRFGKFLKTVEPGLHFKMPLGIDEVNVVPTRRQLKLEFGFQTQAFTNPDQTR